MSTRTLLIAALLAAGCGGSPSVPVDPPADATDARVEPAAAAEAAPAEDAAASDPAAADTAAPADEAATLGAPGAGDAPPTEPATAEVAAAPADEARPRSPEDPRGPPRAEGDDPPFSVDVQGVTRTGPDAATVTILVRTSPETTEALAWTVTAAKGSFAGPKISKDEDDYLFAWTASGIGPGEVRGKVVGALPPHTLSAPFVVPAVEAPAAP